MSHNLKFHTLDVFTTQKFAGNPLAVVLGADGLTTEQMQTITKEFNLSETTFILKPENANNTAKMRIFFPGGEMPFAGHPTIGSAILLANLWGLDEVRFELLAGLTKVAITQIDGQTTATLTAPRIPFHVALPMPSNEQAAAAIGISPDDIGFDAHHMGVIEAGPRFFVVPVKDLNALGKSRILEPHWSNLIAQFNKNADHLRAVDGAYLYCRDGQNYRARMYAPTGGIIEDPATGSATVMMAAQLLNAEKLNDSRHEWNFEQGVEMGRPSQLHLSATVAGGKLNEVKLSGQAVRVMQGEITL